jgi:phosphotransferase system HPr (HPr) family protein
LYTLSKTLISIGAEGVLLIRKLGLMSVFTVEIEVLDPIGMHARPAGQIAKLVKESGLEVFVENNGEEAKANSALRLMAMKVKTGDKIIVKVHTDDESTANGLAVQMQEFLKG